VWKTGSGLYHLNDITVLTEDVLIKDAAFEKKNLKRRKAVYSFQRIVYHRLQVAGCRLQVAGCRLNYVHKIEFFHSVSCKIIRDFGCNENTFFGPIILVSRWPAQLWE